MSKLLIQHQINSDFNSARCSKCQNTFIKSSMTKYNYCPICGCKFECEGYSNKQYKNSTKDLCKTCKHKNNWIGCFDYEGDFYIEDNMKNNKEKIKKALSFREDIINKGTSDNINNYVKMIIAHLIATKQIICSNNECLGCPLDSYCDKITNLQTVVWQKDIKYMK